MEGDPPVWQDVTVSVDTVNNVICAEVSSLSLFVMAEPTCCVQPIRGNVDNDPGDAIDISDLVFLVDYMFTGGPAPECWVEGNVDGSDNGNGIEGPEDIDISDLVYLVDYMFNGGPAPVACP
jgi:hypothetical protein